MRKTLAPVLVAVLAVYSAQQLLTPILAPLSRELTLTETQLGLVVTTAAIALTLLSPVWGRAVDRLGTRTVLLLGLTLATLGLAGFAVAALAGLGGGTSPGVTFVLMLVTRSVVFGAGIAAIPVAALAAASAATEGEQERTRATGMIGAAQGLSLVLGPAAGGALAAGSLSLPLYVAPVVLAVMTLWLFVRAPRNVHTVVTRQRGGPRLWDRRLLPLLVVGFLLYLSLSLVQVTLGFLIADRLGLSSSSTAAAVGVAVAGAGLALIVTQGVLVPKLGWAPRRLLTSGIPIALVAYAVLAMAGQLWSITLAYVILGLGLGLAMPGFTAAPTLVIPREHQGAVAGLVTATIGSTYIAGPVTGTALYDVRPILPTLASLAAAALALLLSLRLPAHTAPPTAPDPADLSTGPPTATN